MSEQLTSWNSLVRSRLPLVVPLPLTSGTAAAMLGVQTECFGSVPESVPFLRALDAQVITYPDSGTDPAHLIAIGRAQTGITFDTYCEEEQRLDVELVTAYPSDGTGFEVGAVFLPKQAEECKQAEDFLVWVVSDGGQALASSTAGQVPISRRLAGNLSQRLIALDIAVYGANPEVESLNCGLEIEAWQAQVYAPRGCTPDEITDSPTPARGSVPARDSNFIRIILGPSIARTGLLSLTAGGIVALLGSFITLALRFAPRRSLIFMPFILLPGLVPSAVSAETLMFLEAPAHSIWTLLETVALNAAPFAAIIMVFGLSSVSCEELPAAKDLGVRGPRVARRILAPALVSTVFPSFAVASLMAVSGVSVPAVNTGREPYLAPLTRHTLNASSDHSLALKILALYLVAGAITTLSLTRVLRLKRASASPSTPSTHTPELFGRVSRALGAALALAGLAALGLVIIVTYRLVVAFLSGSPQALLLNAARESFLALLLVVPITTLIGFITALSNLRRMKALNTVALLGLLASPVAGDILVHIIHRHPLEFAGHVLLPPLVGGGSPAEGLTAILIAYLLLALSAAHFLMVFALSGTRDVRRATEDSGVSRTRTIIHIVIPVRRGRILAALATLSTIVMSMSVSATFVVPAGSAFPAVVFIPYAAHGSTGHVLTFEILGGASVLTMLALATAVLIPTLRRPHV